MGITANLELYLKFDEISGDPIDSQGVYTPLSYGSPITYQPGLLNNAIRFQGPANPAIVQVPDAEGMETPNYTVALFFKPNTWNVNAYTTLSNQQLPSAPYPGHDIRGRNDGTGRLSSFMVSSGVLREVVSSIAIAAGTWYHVAVTYTSPLGLKMYLTPQGGTTLITTGDAGSGAATAGDPTLTIGTHAADQTARCFDGLIDDYRRYTRALTPADVAELVALGFPPVVVSGETRRGKAKQAAVIHKLRTMGAIR